MKNKSCVRAFALQSSGRNSYPPTDLVLWKLTLLSVFFSRGVFFHRYRYHIYLVPLCGTWVKVRGSVLLAVSDTCCGGGLARTFVPYRCLWKNTPSPWAFAMRPSSRNCNPATDLVFSKLIFQPVLLSRGVLCSKTPVRVQKARARSNHFTTPDFWISPGERKHWKHTGKQRTAWRQESRGGDKIRAAA